MAYGKMVHSELAFGERKIRLAIASEDPVQSAMLEAWVRGATMDTVRALGDLPIPLGEIVVIPVRWLGGPVPSAAAFRGTGNGLAVLADRYADLKALRSDWTLYHELGHWAHPYLGGEGRWLAEGLATYFQYQTRVHAGILSEEAAWAAIEDGFRSATDERSTGPLLDADNQRIYWTGTLMALELDAELCRRGAGRLVQAMRRVARAPDFSTTEWAPRRYARALDQASGLHVFAKAYERYAATTEFPDYRTVLSAAKENGISGRCGRQAPVSVLPPHHGHPCTRWVALR